jgi:hypothetical protein
MDVGCGFSGLRGICLDTAPARVMIAEIRA